MHNPRKAKWEHHCAETLHENGWLPALFGVRSDRFTLERACRTADISGKVDYIARLHHAHGTEVVRLQIHTRGRSAFEEYHEVCLTVRTTGGTLCEYYETDAQWVVYVWMDYGTGKILDAVAAPTEILRHLLRTREYRPRRLSLNIDQWFAGIPVSFLEKRGVLWRPEGFEWT